MKSMWLTLVALDTPVSIAPPRYWVAKVGKAVIKLTLNSKLIMKLKNLRDNMVDNSP